jgi:hypothetical protein
MPAPLSLPAAEAKASRRLSVCDGSKLAGRVLVVRGAFHAYDAGDRPLGTFPTQRAALAALPPPARGGGHG